MKNTTPTCVDDEGELTFTVDDQIKSDTQAWSDWKFTMRISVKLPSDRILQGTTLNTWFSDASGVTVYASTAEVTGFLTVSKPTTTNTPTAMVSFGVSPDDSAEILNGVGVYSNTFCIGASSGDTDLGTGFKSNCALDSAIDATVTSGEHELETVNVMELEFVMPHAVPNDRTKVMVVCETELVDTVDSAVKRWTLDPLRIYQSSVATNGFGTGNCFYNGPDNTNAEAGNHVFCCENVGALAASAKL